MKRFSGHYPASGGQGAEQFSFPTLTHWLRFGNTRIHSKPVGLIFSPSWAHCPLCQRPDCYQSIPPYWRYAQELFPEFRKERIPVARFLCCLLGLTFSLLPTQLVPYCQYTVTAIIGALLLGLASRQQGEQGFQGTVLAVDPDSLVTPWLVACWLVLVRNGLRRAHAVLRRWFDLDQIRTGERSEQAWEESPPTSALGLESGEFAGVQGSRISSISSVGPPNGFCGEPPLNSGGLSAPGPPKQVQPTPDAPEPTPKGIWFGRSISPFPPTTPQSAIQHPVSGNVFTQPC